MTNFDISRYDVKRICSSSTLIASDLAKRSPKESAPLALEDYSSASASPQQPLLSITNGDPAEELADMVWSSNTDDNHNHHHQNTSIANDTSLVASTSRPSSALHSPKGGSGGGPGTDQFGAGGADYPQAYFSLHGSKFQDGGSSGGGGDDHSGSDRLRNMSLVHQQVPMFALWNE